MFWTDDINILFEPVLIPSDDMQIDEKLNAVTRLIMFICIIIALLLQDIKFILLMIILVLGLIVLYKYQDNLYKVTDNFLNEKNLKVVDKKICKKPTKNNPFMNPMMSDKLENQDYSACPSYTKPISDEVDELYDTSMYTNVDDIYNRNTGIRQFYTVPGNKIPNEQTVFANWLYNRGKSCKENNGIRCYDNLYRDLRI